MHQRYIDLHVIVAKYMIKLCSIWACFGWCLDYSLMRTHSWMEESIGLHFHIPSKWLSTLVLPLFHQFWEVLMRLSACSRDTHCIVGWKYLPSIYKLLIILRIGQRLRNFEIRIGMDRDEIGKNAICYKQSESMEPDVVRNFTCYRELFGNWVSINKTEPEVWFRPLHFREVRVFGTSSKCISHPYLW